MHCLTSNGNWELRIDFTFDNGTKSFMHYSHFRVGPATDNYRLSTSGFTGITLDEMPQVLLCNLNKVSLMSIITIKGKSKDYYSY